MESNLPVAQLAIARKAWQIAVLRRRAFALGQALMTGKAVRTSDMPDGIDKLRDVMRIWAEAERAVKDFDVRGVGRDNPRDIQYAAFTDASASSIVWPKVGDDTIDWDDIAERADQLSREFVQGAGDRPSDSPDVLSSWDDLADDADVEPVDELDWDDLIELDESVELSDELDQLQEREQAVANARMSTASDGDVAEVVRSTMRRSSRNTVKALSDASNGVMGYIRRSRTGTPCGFCAMLMSRGPVYRSAKTAANPEDKYHTNCDCEAVPVYNWSHWENDPSFELNRTFNSMWDDDDSRQERLDLMRRKKRPLSNPWRYQVSRYLADKAKEDNSPVEE